MRIYILYKLGKELEIYFVGNKIKLLVQVAKIWQKFGVDLKKFLFFLYKKKHILFKLLNLYINISCWYKQIEI